MMETDRERENLVDKSEQNNNLQQREIESIENPKEEETLFDVLLRLLTIIFFPDRNSPPPPLLQRIKNTIDENAYCSLRKSTKNSTRKLLLWSRRGGPFRPLIVISVGTIMLLSLTGLLVFCFFLLAASFNAVVISLLVSLAAAGGLLALFFACLATIYVMALSGAVFIIFTVTVSAIIGVTVVTGWVAFLLGIWLVAKKSIDLMRHSLSLIGSTLSSYSTIQVQQREPAKTAQS